MGMSSTEWSRYMHERGWFAGATGRDQPRGRRSRMLDRYSERLPLIDGAVEAVDAAGGALAARARLVVEPRADRPRPRARGPHALLQGDGVVGGGGARQACARRLPRGGATARRRTPPAASRSRTRASGIRSAHAAGMQVVAIPNRAFPPPADVLALASVVVESIEELDPELVTEAARLSTPSSGSALPGPARTR